MHAVNIIINGSFCNSEMVIYQGHKPRAMCSQQKMQLRQYMNKSYILSPNVKPESPVFLVPNTDRHRVDTTRSNLLKEKGVIN